MSIVILSNGMQRVRGQGDWLQVRSGGASIPWVAEWLFDNNALDAIGGNDLSPSVSSPTFTTGILAKVNGATHVSAASSQYWRRANNAALTMGDIDSSLLCWVWLDSLVTGTFISKWNQGGNDREYFVQYQTTTNLFRFGVSIDGVTFTSVDATKFGTPFINYWHFIASWHDSVANTLNIQVNNGDIDSVSYASGVRAGSSDFYIGANNNGSIQFFNGRIDDVRIAKSTAGLGGVLSAPVRKSIYDASSGIVIPVAGGPYYVGYMNAGHGNQTLTYGIAYIVSSDGIGSAQAAGVLPAGNPLLRNGVGWEVTEVKDPFALRDGSTYKMWYSGLSASGYQIGYATSVDGYAWTKYASNPVISVGTGGSFDEKGCMFPCVYKDASAIPSKRYRMLYVGKDASGNQTIGYAYSADGVSWTKGSANPVIGLGAGGSWDDKLVGFPSIYKEGLTYYCYYGGRHIATNPVDDQVGVATFTDFEGTYTKSGSNPILAHRTGSQNLTADLALNGTVVHVADTSAFVANEVVILGKTPGVIMQNRIATIDSGTQLTLAIAANVAFPTAASSVITSDMIAIDPRTVVKEGGVYKMTLTAYQGAAGVGALAESTGYATSSDPVTGWTVPWLSNPPLWLPQYGAKTDWAGQSAENLNWLLDADTYTRFTM